MKFEIRPAKNGVVLKVDHGDEGEEPEEIVYQESDGNEIEAFADFLHFINDHYGPSTSRYSPKRIHITIKPGDKWERDSSAVEHDDEDDDLPQSLEEAQADAEDARMQLLLDRVTARLDRGEFEFEDFDRIYEEERTRLMRERGEKDPVLTPEELEERRQWIEEMNAIAAEALVDLEAEKWKGPEPEEEENHPLVEECSDLAVALYHEIHNAGWLPEDAHQEHPLWEIQSGVSCASAKLAGALGISSRYDEWPPDRMIAGNVIVRLKKARGYLRDALRGLDSAEEEALATPQWRHQTRLKVIDVLAQTDDLLREVREVLAEEDDDTGIF